MLIAALFFSTLSVSWALAAGSVSPTNDPANGFPTWYQDANGVRVGQCVNGDDPVCVLPAAGESAFNPDAPTVFPGNFPEEHFYYMATSAPIATPGDKSVVPAIQPADLSVEFAVEGAFLNGTVADGDQMVFGRIRVVGDGLRANSTYTITHPYGTDTYATDAGGRISRKVGTEDIGCGASPCDFTAALTSRVFNGFLVSTSAPAGYLGDNVSETPVTGGPLGNTVTVSGPGFDVPATTDKFVVSGKRFVNPAPCTATAPTAVTLNTPADGATGVALNASASWAATASFGVNCAGNTNGYQVLMNQGSVTPTTIVGNTNAATTTLALPGLQANTTYSWKVRTTNGSQTADSVVRTFTTTATVAGNETPPPAGSQNVYRLYHPGLGDHFYTASAAERDAASRLGYQSEGVAFLAASSPNSSPVYRLYHPGLGDHFYTASAAERDAASRLGYQSEGVAFFGL